MARVAHTAHRVAQCQASPGGGACGWLGSRRVRLAMVLLVGLPVIFQLQRVVLAWLSRADLAGVTSGALLRIFAVGLRYDLRALAYVLIPLTALLTLASNAALSRRWMKAVLAGYASLTVTVAAIICIGDALFFLYYGTRLNYAVTSYLGNGEIITHLWQHYPVALVVAGALVTLAGAYLLARRLLLSGPAPAAGPAWARIACGVVLAGAICFCARGSARRPALDSSLAHFSSNNVVSELSLNPGLTLAAAVKDHYTEGEDESLHYPLLGEADAIAAARQALRQDENRFCGDPANPLRRMVRTGRPRRDLNVVIIVLESFAGKDVGALGNAPSRTPFFDRLARQGVFCSQMFATGPRTSRGLSGVMCGLPNLGSESILERPRAQGNCLTLFGMFGRRGYRTMFVHGGDGHFDNMKRFFRSNGVERVIDIDQMPRDAWRTNWGVADHVMFDAAHRRFLQAADKPFFALLLTLTNHQPYHVPPNCIDLLPGDSDDVRMTNTIRYTDWALERFFQRARQSDYFRKTLFVLVADHGRQFDRRRLVDVDGYRVPCLFYAPQMPQLQPRVISMPCSQTDIGPTLLSLLGGTFSHPMFGRNLLAAKAGDPGLALLRADRRMALVQGKLALIFPPDSQPILFRRTDDGGLDELPPGQQPLIVDGMRRTAMGLYQSARRLYLTKSYTAPPVQ